MVWIGAGEGRFDGLDEPLDAGEHRLYVLALDRRARVVVRQEAHLLRVSERPPHLRGDTAGADEVEGEPTLDAGVRAGASPTERSAAFAAWNAA